MAPRNETKMSDMTVQSDIKEASRLVKPTQAIAQMKLEGLDPGNGHVWTDPRNAKRPMDESRGLESRIDVLSKPLFYHTYMLLPLTSCWDWSINQMLQCRLPAHKTTIGVLLCLS